MKHQCHRCTSSFCRPYRLAQHLLTHDNLKVFSCTEEGCLKAYTNKSHLDRHINTIHKKNDIDVIHRCPKCMKIYSNRQNLKKHLKVIHIHPSKVYLCDICNIEFKKKHQLKAHMYTHTGVKSFSCDICLKDFVSLSEKKKHMRCHKTYKCDDCLMSFNYWSEYMKHRIEVHKSKELICNYCGKSFKQKSHMLNHAKRHVGQQEDTLKQIFKCTYENCCRTYSRNSNLTQHILAKHSDLVHECHICHAQLSHEVTLRQHLKLHKDDKPKKPKDSNTVRKSRKDKGNAKTSTAAKLAGVKKTIDLVLTRLALNNTNVQVNEDKTLS